MNRRRSIRPDVALSLPLWLSLSLWLPHCAAAPATVARPLTGLPIAGLLKDGVFDAGPVALQLPPGAVVPADGAALAALLADPKGPTDIWLGARSYRGDFVVRRTVALHGSGPESLLQGTGRGTVLDVTANGALLENFALTGTGGHHTSEDAAVKLRGERNTLSRLAMTNVLFGASLQACHDCRVQRLHVQGQTGTTSQRGDGIKLWESHGSVIENCLVEDVRDMVVWYSRKVTVQGCVVRRSRYGCHFMYAHDSAMRRSALLDNTVGVFVMYSARLSVRDSVLAGARGPAGIGLGCKDSDDITIAGNWLVGNTVGNYLDSTPNAAGKFVRLNGNVLAVNDIALRLHGRPHGVAVHDNDWRDNAEVVQVDSGGDATSADVVGNYWSDYVGFDLNDDGVGDVAFELKQLSSEWTDQHPALKLLHGTLALATVDAVARAVPVLSSKRLISDARPAMAPHKLTHE